MLLGKEKTEDGARICVNPIQCTYKSRSFYAMHVRILRYTQRYSGEGEGQESAGNKILTIHSKLAEQQLADR